MKKLGLAITAVTCAAVMTFGFTACSGKSAMLGSPGNVSMLSYAERNESVLLDDVSTSANAFAAQFAAKAFGQYTEESNFVIAPVSVYMALSMAAECAAGDTRTEILSAFNISYSTLSSGFSDFYRSLIGEYYTESITGRKKMCEVAIGNSVWVDSSVKANKQCVDNLADKYICYSYQTDFANANKNANAAIRRFVKEHTNGLIDQDFNLPQETLFTLINTLYLKDTWNFYGDDLSFTSDSYNFKNSDGSAKSTKLLEGYYNAGKPYEGDGYTAFYTKTQHNMRLKFIVPDDGYSVSDVFTAENIAKVNSIKNFDSVDEGNKIIYNTRCFFPEFTASYNNDVKPLLNQMGINSLFDMGKCDFSPMMDSKAYCSAVQHATKLEVSKKGIEGAAVTAMPAGDAGPGPYQEVFLDYIVDRSFGFILTDYYDNTLFSGVVLRLK